MQCSLPMTQSHRNEYQLCALQAILQSNRHTQCPELRALPVRPRGRSYNNRDVRQQERVPSPPRRRRRRRDAAQIQQCEMKVTFLNSVHFPPNNRNVLLVGIYLGGRLVQLMRRRRGVRAYDASWTLALRVSAIGVAGRGDEVVGICTR